MDFDETVQIFSSNTKNLYELGICINPTELIQVDRMTYMFLLQNTIPKIIAEFETSGLEDYGELLVIVFARYCMERFPSMRAQILLHAEQMRDALQRAAGAKNYVVMTYVSEALFRLLLNNSEAFAHFQKQLPTFVNNLLFAAPDFQTEVGDTEYEQPLVPQQTIASFSPILYYTFKLFERYEDDQLFELHFPLLLCKQENIIVRAFQNMIFVVTSTTQLILKVMRRKNLLATLSKTQRALQDSRLSFIIRLILKETMDDHYSDEVLVQLAGNCIVDHNLLSFFEKQVIEHQAFTGELMKAVAQMLSDTLLDLNYYDKNKRIIQSVVGTSPHIFVEHFSTIICAHEYSPECELFLYEKFVEMFNTEQLNPKCQEQILITLQTFYYDNNQNQQFVKWFTKFSKLLSDKHHLWDVESTVSKFYAVILSDLAQDIIKQFSKINQINFIYIIAAFTKAISVQQFEQFKFHTIFLKLANNKPVTQLICINTLVEKALGIHQQTIQHGFESIFTQIHSINNSSLKLQSCHIISSIIEYVYEKQDFNSLYFILACLMQCYGLNKPETPAEVVDKVLVSTLYKIWRCQTRRPTQRDDNMFCYDKKKITTVAETNYVISEKLLLFLLSKNSSNLLELELIDFNSKQHEFINVAKYAYVVTSFMLRRRYNISPYNYISQIPSKSYSSLQDLIVPVNKKEQCLNQVDVINQKMLLNLANLEFEISVILKQNGEIFSIFNDMPFFHLWTIILKREGSESFCYFTIFNVCFKFVFVAPANDVYNIKIYVRETQDTGFILEQAPFRNQIYYDDNSKKYKNILQKDKIHNLEFILNDKCLGVQQLCMPANSLYVLEQYSYKFTNNCNYIQMSMKMNKYLIFQLAEGLFSTYRIAVLQKKQEKYNIVNITQQKMYQLSEFDLISIISDMYLIEKQQLIVDEPKKIFSESGGLQIVSEQSNSKSTALPQMFIIQYESDDINVEEYAVQRKFLSLISHTEEKLQQIILRPNYDSQQQQCVIDVLVHNLTQSRNVMFDIQFLKCVIYSSKQSHDQFIIDNSIQKIVATINQSNYCIKDAKLVLRLMSIVGIQYLLENETVKEVEIIKNAYIDGIICILSKQQWVDPEIIAFTQKYIIPLVNVWMQLNYTDRLKLFNYIMNSCISSQLKSPSDEKLQFISWLSNELAKSYCDFLAESTFIGSDYDEIFQLGHIINSALFNIISKFGSVPEDQLFDLCKNAIFKFCSDIDKVCDKKMRDRCQMTESLQKSFWFLSLISNDLLYIMLEQLRSNDHMIYLLNIISITQSATEMIKNVKIDDLLKTDYAQNAQYVQHTVKNLNLQNELFKIVSRSDITSQVELLKYVSKLIVNKYIVDINDELEIIQCSEQDKQIIINSNAYFLTYSIIKQIDQKQHYFDKIVKLADRNSDISNLITFSLIDIINDCILSNFVQDSIYKELLSLMEQSANPQKTIKFIIKCLIDNQDAKEFKCNSLCFVIYTVNSIIQKQKECKFGLLQCREKLYSQLGSNCQDTEEILVIQLLFSAALSISAKNVEASLILMLIIFVSFCNQQATMSKKILKALLSFSQCITSIFSNQKLSSLSNYLRYLIQTMLFSQIAAATLQNEAQNPSIQIEFDQLQGVLEQLNVTDQLRDAILKQQVGNPEPIKLQNNFQLSQLLQCASSIIDSAQILIDNIESYQCKKQECIVCNVNSTCTANRVEKTSINISFQQQSITNMIQMFLSTNKYVQSGNVIFESDLELSNFCNGFLNQIIVSNGTNYQLMKFIFLILQIQHKNKPIQILNQQITNILDQVSNRQLRKSMDSQEEIKDFTDSQDQFIKYLRDNIENLVIQFYNENVTEILSKTLLQIYRTIHMWSYIQLNIITENQKQQSQALLQTIKQSLTKFIEENSIKNIDEYVEKLLISNLNQQLTQIYQNDLMTMSPVDQFTLLSQKKFQSSTFYLSQSEFINGEAAEKLTLKMRSTNPITLNAEEILKVFGVFRTMDIDMFYSMCLNISCSRVSYVCVHSGFMYVFEDAPNGVNFLQIKQSDSFKDFDHLVQASINETMKALNKLKEAEHTTAELFSQQFWEPRLQRVHVDKILTMAERDYGGLCSALDIHVNNGQVFSIVFTSYFELQRFVQVLIACRPKLLRFASSVVHDTDVTFPSLSIQELKLPAPDYVQKQLEHDLYRYLYQLLAQWKAGKIQTQRLLHELNIISGRSLNDLSQYHIFPLCYGCLQENQEPTARIMRLPVLFQGQKRLNDLIQKCTDALEFGQNQPLSAIHYAHCALPGWWMIRQEPFTSAHLLLQNCRFDSADRLFSSVISQYRSATQNNQQNCEEAPPELFYDHSFLLNINCNAFGKLQGGDQVWDVKVPETGGEPHLTYMHMMGEYLGLDAMKPSLLEWIQMMFSNTGHQFKIAGRDVSVYPPVSNAAVVASAHAERSLQIVMQQANEQSQQSAVMKLLYFGRQPFQLFAKQELSPHVTADEREEAGAVLSKFVAEYRSRAAEEEQPDISLRKIPVQLLKLGLVPSDIVPAFHATGITTSFGVKYFKSSKLILRPGMLSGRLLTANIQTHNTTDYRLGGTTKLFQSDPPQQPKATSSNSLLINSKAYVIPQGMVYLQAPGLDLALTIRDTITHFYKLPFCTPYDSQYLGEATCAVAGPSNFAYMSATNDIFLGRQHGCVDIIAYDAVSRKHQTIAYFPVPGAVKNLWYCWPWGILVVLTEYKVTIIETPHLQKMFEIQIKDVLDVQFSTIHPLMFILERGKLRIFNFRTGRESTALEEGFASMCYCDERDELLLSKNNLLLKVKNVWKRHLVVKKWDVGAVGSVDTEEVGLSQICKIWIQETEVWLHVTQGNVNVLQVFNLDRL